MFGFSSKEKFLSAAKNGNVNKVKRFLSEDGDINIQNSKEETALMLASQKGKKDIVRLLIDSGADLNKENRKSQQAIHFSVINEHKSIVEMLAKAGSELEGLCRSVDFDKINTSNFDGSDIWTPIRYALYKLNIDIIKILLKARAKPNAVDVKYAKLFVEASNRQLSKYSKDDLKSSKEIDEFVRIKDQLKKAKAIEKLLVSKYKPSS